jgi:HSP20 family molecular chaperone IbpA
MSNVKMTAENGRAKQGVERPTLRPRVDVYENDAEYLVLADLPGVAGDAIDVRFEAGELHIEASRTLDAPGTPLVEEYRGATFARTFAMPDGIDSEAIEAKLANGVLEVKLPKTAAKRPRRIEVRTS